MADLLDLRAAVTVVGGLSIVSGLVVATRMQETVQDLRQRPAQRSTMM